MSVNLENGNNNYREKIEELRIKYPLGIPADEVILLCQNLEIYYLVQIIEDKTEMNKIVSHFKNYTTFSTN